MRDRLTPDLDLEAFRVAGLAAEYRSRARENAPATVELAVTGVVLGSLAFGPAGGVLGATVGSVVGYLRDEGHLDRDDGLGAVSIRVGDGE